MAVVPTIYYARYHNDSINPIQIIFGSNKLAYNVCACSPVLKNPPSILNRKQWPEISSYGPSAISITAETRKSRRGFEPHAWECSSTNEKQLRSLGSYFGRLKGGGNKRKFDSLEKIGVLDTGQFTAKKELQLLDDYFEKVDKGKFFFDIYPHHRECYIVDHFNLSLSVDTRIRNHFWFKYFH